MQGICDIMSGLAQRRVAIVLISGEAMETYFNADRVLHMRQRRRS